MNDQDKTVGTMNVRGQEVAVRVSFRTPRKGSPMARFTARIGEAPVSAETMEGLYAAAMNEARRQTVKVEVPFTTWRRGPVRGIATGFHAGSGKVMANLGGGGGVQYDGSYRSDLRPLDADETAEWERLREAEAAAVVALAKFEEPRRIRLRDEVEQAMRDAMGGGD
jgi:hypothetical protein